VNLRRSGNGAGSYPLAAERVLIGDRVVLDEGAFLRVVALERKRTERSGKPFLLMLLDMGEQPRSGSARALRELVDTISISTRETDVAGWYKEGSTVGVMFIELDLSDRASLMSTMIRRISETLRSNLTLEQFNQVNISFHLYPEEWNVEQDNRRSNPRLYPDLEEREQARKSFSVAKRTMDLIGSLLALIVFSPVLAIIAAAIKLTSPGPIFFRQQRIGQHGLPFTFLKFRSMKINNDASQHREYVQRLIAGKAEKHPSNGSTEGVYKLTRDPRITRVGAFLRKTSLDELPQFINVLRGEMSLVGPRPPVPYEVEAYSIWHRRRLLEAKPGITGLWQVSGRSRIKFDEMVRLDLRYARSWSPWMDIKIILRTPAAMVLGEGA